MSVMPDPDNSTQDLHSELDKGQLIKTVIELGPVVLFGLSYYFYGLIPATGVLMAASVISALASKLLLGHVGLMPIVTAVVAVLFGGMTLWFHDSTYIKMKPTIIYLAFGGFLGFGLATKRNFLAALFGQVFNLTAQGWRLLTIRWMLFFVALAITNEYIWRNYSEQTWVYMKLFGFTGATLLFAVFQIGLLNKHANRSEGQD